VSDRSPTVSVVTATYNRAQCLRYSVASVLAQTVADLELIVVGDACTDETGEVLASFDDPRVRFVNLERNVGEQSGPNNAGVAMARGRLIAFCNHDDLWFPDHLERGIEHLEATAADLVTTLFARLRPDGDHELGWVMPEGSYVPYSLLPASSWLLRRELCEKVGP
jgi:glycosyltransferase involved in cell wall biosynthesis